VPEIPLNLPYMYVAEGSGVVGWNGRTFGVAYTEGRWDACFDIWECGAIDFRLVDTRAWCPGPPPPPTSDLPSSPPLRLAREGGKDLRFYWEDLPEATTYNIYAGFGNSVNGSLNARTIYDSLFPYPYLGPDNQNHRCHSDGEPAGDGRRTFLLERSVCTASNCPHRMAYFLVSASNEHGEGSLGHDSEGRERDPEKRVCLADR
jgi:hypothetical protein